MTRAASRHAAAVGAVQHASQRVAAAPYQLGTPGGASRETSTTPPATRQVSPQTVLVNSLLWLISSTPPSNSRHAVARAPSAAGGQQQAKRCRQRGCGTQGTTECSCPAALRANACSSKQGKQLLGLTLPVQVVGWLIHDQQVRVVPHSSSQYQLDLLATWDVASRQEEGSAASEAGEAGTPLYKLEFSFQFLTGSQPVGHLFSNPGRRQGLKDRVQMQRVHNKRVREDSSGVDVGVSRCAVPADAPHT